MGWVDLGHSLVYFIPELNGALATGPVIIDGTPCVAKAAASLVCQQYNQSVK